MVRCKDCLHFRTGNLVEEPWGHCGKTWSEKGEPDDESTKAYSKDGDSYWGVLVVSPDFGCIQGELPKRRRKAD